MVTNHDKIVSYISSFIIPIIGFVLFFVWLSTKKPERKRIAINSLCFSLASLVLFSIIGFATFYAI